MLETINNMANVYDFSIWINIMCFIAIFIFIFEHNSITAIVTIHTIINKAIPSAFPTFLRPAWTRVTI